MHETFDLIPDAGLMKAFKPLVEAPLGMLA
jgi:hypothetical protein